VTPQILGKLSSYGVERIAGFSLLRTEDQERVRQALKKRRVDPVDVTGSVSSSGPLPQPSQPPSPKKRKADAIAGPSQTQTQNVVTPSPARAAFRQAAVGGAAWEEGADAEEVVDQQVDELFCTLSSNVVGVQYYKGGCFNICYKRVPYRNFA
jgi:SWI/SNF-related matrix-associated actin-dependent regulator of chromatin subfamily A3